MLTSVSSARLEPACTASKFQDFHEVLSSHWYHNINQHEQERWYRGKVITPAQDSTSGIGDQTECTKQAHLNYYTISSAL